jgi:hypothetical protein
MDIYMRRRYNTQPANKFSLTSDLIEAGSGFYFELAVHEHRESAATSQRSAQVVDNRFPKKLSR